MEQTMEERIGRYLAGEMAGQELSDFEQELMASPALQQSLSEYSRIWEMTHVSPEETAWDTETAWERFESSQATQARKIPLRKPLLAWAAAAVILVLFSTFFFFQKATGPKHYASDGASIEPIVLSDGSRAYLNKGADITVYRFTRKFREVHLNGEAYFEIASDHKRPFKVISGGTVTEVVGTSFNIRQSSGKTNITVNSGKVIFSSKENSQKAVALTAGEAAVFQDNQIQLIPNPSSNVHAWRTHQLEFKNMPLSDVIQDVSTYFGQNIRIENDAVRSCRISIIRPFRQPDIQSLLKAVAASINAKLVKEGDTLILRGGDCS